MRSKRGLTTTRPGSPNRYENFSVRGHRFRRSLGTAEIETAEILAGETRRKALLGEVAPAQKPAYTLSRALGRYLEEHGQFLPSALDIDRMGHVLQADLGKHTPLSALTADQLAQFAARRRATLSNRSVNVELEHLRAVLRRAGKLWGVAVPDLPWKELLLEEPGERELILSAAEEARLFAALRPDYHAFVRFALLSGARRDNVVGLTWRQIDWQAGTVAWQQKSKRPGGRAHVLRLTPSLRALLLAERGRHPVFVFTYLCRRNRHDRHSGQMQEKGSRYPFTRNGWRKEWGRALRAAGIDGLRFHDLRHTAATRTMLAGGDIRAAQQQLGHATIATTTRYAKYSLDGLAEIMERAASGTIPSQGADAEPKKRNRRRV